MEPLYHITDPKNVDAILRDGLKRGEDGYIYLFANPVREVADSIAANQCFLDVYAMFEVQSDDAHMYAEPDNVGELTARFQCRVGMCDIPASAVRMVGYRRVDTSLPFFAQYYLGQMRGLTREQVEQQHKVTMWFLGELKKGKRSEDELKAEMDRRLAKIAGASAESPELA